MNALANSRVLTKIIDFSWSIHWFLGSGSRKTMDAPANSIVFTKNEISLFDWKSHQASHSSARSTSKTCGWNPPCWRSKSSLVYFSCAITSWGCIWPRKDAVTFGLWNRWWISSPLCPCSSIWSFFSTFKNVKSTASATKTRTPQKNTKTQIEH